MNRYGGSIPLLVNSGTFGRCRHGITLFYDCWRCGLFHPVRFVRSWWSRHS